MNRFPPQRQPPLARQPSGRRLPPPPSSQLPPLDYTVEGMPKIPFDYLNLELNELPRPPEFPIHLRQNQVQDQAQNQPNELNEEFLLSLPRDVMFNVLSALDPVSLGRLCRASPRLDKICKNREFWEYKYRQDFGNLDVKDLYYRKRYTDANLAEQLKDKIMNLLFKHVNIGVPISEQQRTNDIVRLYAVIKYALNFEGGLFTDSMYRYTSEYNFDGFNNVRGIGEVFKQERLNFLTARADLFQQIEAVYKSYLEDTKFRDKYNSKLTK